MISRLRPCASYAVLALLCLPAVYPYLGGEVPRTNDLAMHVYRALELEQLLRAGALFPRWGPHLVHGYGYPIYNYFAYLSHYLITLVHLLTGSGYLWAYRLVVVIVTMASACGAYLLARDLFASKTSGLLAAIGFVYSPYLLLTANVRGGLPESLALAALPFALWTWRRAALGQPRFVVWGAVAYAVVIFSHNGFALQVSPVLLAFALWSGRTSWLRAIGYTAVAAFAGLLLSAFYWLPALSELSFAQIAEGYASTGISYYNNFSPMHDLFIYPPVPVDSDMLNPPVSNPVGIVTLALAILALAFSVRCERSIRGDILGVSALACGCLFLVLPQSRFIWDAIPLLQRTLWPWRFVGPASLFVALVASHLANYRSQVSSSGRQTSTLNFQLLAGPAILLLVMLNGLPWFYPPREPIADPENVADLAAFELPPWLIGTSTTAEYLPKWVLELPDSAAQQATLLGNPDPDRLDRSLLPVGVIAQHTANGLLREEYRVESPSDVTLTFRHFFFPGWRATIDDASVAIAITQPHGLMAIEVPAGQHTLALYFGSTPVRTAAGFLSLATLLFASLLLPAVKGYRSRVRRTASSLTSEALPLPVTGEQSLRPYFIFSLFIFPIFIASAHIDHPLRRHGLARGSKPLTMQHALGVDFGGELWLHGYSLSEEAIAADGQVQLDMYWQAKKPLGVVYGFNVRLLDSLGRMWNTLEIVRPVGWRFIPGTDVWPPDKYVFDNYALRPLPGTPPGEYHLEVVAFRKDTLQPLHTARLGSLQIARPDRTSFAGARPLALLGEEWWTLWDLQVDRSEAAPGELIGIHAVWGGVGVVTERRNVRLSLEDIDGETEAQFDFQLSPEFPAGRWQPGEALRDQYIFRLPASIPGGAYSWRVNLLGPDGSTVGEYLTGISLNVSAPVRSFSAPDGTVPVNVSLGDTAVLSGYLLNRRSVAVGDKLALTLVWKARTEIPESYRVFVHLIDESGGLRAQSDGEPAGWSRPTSGWLPEEYVSDYHTLKLPRDLEQGSYSLRAGMYHPHTGERLAAAVFPDGSVLITDITVLGD